MTQTSLYFTRILAGILVSASIFSSGTGRYYNWKQYR